MYNGDIMVVFFVCESNMLGTAERICAKFTGKTCLVPRSNEFECQGQRAKVKVTMDKKCTNGMRSVQITSCCSRRDHFVAVEG